MELLDEERLPFQTRLREVKVEALVEETPENTEEPVPEKQSADTSSP